MPENEVFPIENESGQVALQYYQPIQKYVEVNSAGYVFTVRADISLTWVNPADVGAILAIRGGCNCSSSKQPVFRYAVESSVRRWINGGGS